MLHGVVIDGVDTLTEYGLILLADLSEGEAEPKTELLDIPEDLYVQYESGEQDLPFTFMHKCSMAFGVELTELMEGYSAPGQPRI